jgi:ankyrin repeat protein
MSNCQGEHPIIKTAICGDAARIQAILGADPAAARVRDSYIRSTPLHFAAHRGHLEVVRLLLDAGAEIDAREGVSATTALHWAAEGGHADVAGLLLDRGADLEAIDTWYGLAPLGWTTVACCAPERHRDRPGTTRLLLDRGARVDPFSAVVLGLEVDPDAADRRLGFVGEGRQPLHLAVERDRPEAVRQLRRAGLTDLGVSALALAQDNAAMAGLLRELGAAADLSAALVRGDLAAAEHLALHPALLHFFVRRGQVDAVRHLLDRGADPSHATAYLYNEQPSTTTPLHQAAERGSEELVRLLLDRGADPNARAAETDITPLHRAAACGQAQVLRLLLDRGADASVRDRQHGGTPAGFAAYNGHEQVAALLNSASGHR